MRVAITGASGSLGRALLSRLTRTGGADRIVAFSRDEQKRAALVRDFGWHPAVRVYAGNVRDVDRLIDIFHGCEAVVHGAARKVVAAHPDEPEEMLKTNVLGSVNVVIAARKAGVKKLVAVSSDKAVRPENSYGVSKALMEHLVVNANARTLHDGLRCCCVRYGNVIGSTGSVVAVWRAQVAAGRPVTVSNPAMTRFWISLPRAVDLILHAISNVRGGEIFVPRLPCASVGDLAAAVAGDGWPVVPMGSGVPMEPRAPIRQGGEKVHEELLSAAEVRRAVERHGYYVVPPFQHAEMWDASPWLGVPVPPDLVYRSDVWPWRATAEELGQMIEDEEPAPEVAHEQGG